VLSKVKPLSNFILLIVLYDDYISKEFEVKTGLRQGDALSPMLFNIALVSVVRGLYDMDVGVRLLNKKIKLLAYADDIGSANWQDSLMKLSL